MKACKKLTTLAVIIKAGKVVSFGTNEIENNIDICPRINLPTGEGYELCKSVCNQKYHAEERACVVAGMKAKGGTLYLFGHSYCCDNCKDVMNTYGIKEVIIL